MFESLKQTLLHVGFRKYFFNTSWLMVEKVLRLVVGLFIGVYVARYLGPSRFGLLSFSMSFVALFGTFAKLGLDGIVVRNAVQSPETRDELLGTAFGLRIFGGVALLALVFGAVQLTDSEPVTRLLIMIIAAGYVLQAFQVIEFYFQSQVLARLISIAGITGLIFSSVFKLFLVLSGASLVWFAWAVIVENGIRGVVLIVLHSRRNSFWHWQFRIEQARGLIRDAWPLILSGLVIAVYMRVDQVMIKAMLDDAAVGYYAAAVKLSEAWYFVPMAITQSLFPAILNAKKSSEALYYKRLQNLYDLMVWLGIAVALPMTFLSGWLVVALFGAEYSEAGYVLAIHIWAGLFVAMGVASSRWLIVENLQIISAVNTTIGAVLNIFLNYYLLPIFGAAGAAYATILSYSIAAYLALALHPKSRVNFFLLTKSLNFFRFPRMILKL